MDFRKLAQQAVELGYQSVAGGFGMAGQGVGYVMQMVGSLRLFGSTQTLNADQAFDERHYFLVPDPRCEDGYSLVVTRCLPEGVPPINELPKRRILHLPHLESEAMLRALLVRQAQSQELSKPATGKSMADRAREIADYIDVLDERVFGGILLIGGLVAIFNPLAGAAIAAKSLLPSLGMFASKYGLRIAEESLNEADLKRKIKQAEKDVLKQFQGSDTRSLSNSILAITEKALRTSEDQFDPMMELHTLLQSDLDSDQRRMLDLASLAVLDVFDTALKSNAEAAKAGLGPEDLRFLQMLTSITQSRSTSN